MSLQIESAPAIRQELHQEIESLFPVFRKLGVTEVLLTSAGLRTIRVVVMEERACC